MIYRLITRKIKVIFVFTLVLACQLVFSQATFTANPTDAQINTALNGTGLTISGGNLVNGSRPNQIATFANGMPGASLGIDNGVFFSTGNVTQNLSNRNSVRNRSDNPMGGTTYSDVNLSAIDPTAIRDNVVYSFTVTLGPSTTSIRLSYQFGSEEYPDYVGSAFDDNFGFFVTGPGIAGTVNMARLPNNNVTSINKVNAGVQGFSGTNNAALDLTQSAFYINNGHTTTIAANGRYVQNPATQPGPFPVFVEFNGITTVINRNLTGLTPGGTYTFKIAIADAGGDASYDSGVFITQLFGVNAADVSVTKTISNPTPVIGSNVVFTVTAANAGPDNTVNAIVNDILPSGYTFVSANPSVGTYNNTTGVWNIGSLNIGDTPTLQITATVNATGANTNTATISAFDPDPNLANNTSSISPTCISPTAPTVASTTQPTCAVPTGTIVFTAQAGVEYSINNGTTYQAGATFAGLAPGTYTLRVRSIANNTCSTPAASTVTINAVPTAPTAPTVASTTQPTCAVPTGTIVFTTQAGVTYSINNGTTYQASATFAGLAPGTYTLRVRSTTDTTCSTPAASTVTINAVPTAPTAPTVASTTQPTCAVPT
ncbi:MAG: choice-of-anchor L domain-containing protein, partial [Flavobacterium sp.]|uniref:choice-of-anchor L domain-containing protein n=1 Tax=Flavobacterium sp. TaxID=239 RepID=UPI0022CA788F